MLQPGETRTVTVASAAGASAVALNVTTIVARWVLDRARRCPAPNVQPELDRVKHVSANQVIVPVDGSGSFQVFSSGGGHLIIDVVGSFTGSTAPDSTDGLFVPLASPTRFADTRVGSLNPLGGTTNAQPRWSVEVPVTSNPAIGRSDVAAVVMNVTSLDNLNGGYVSVTPAGSNPPDDEPCDLDLANSTDRGRPGESHHRLGHGRGFDVFLEQGNASSTSPATTSAPQGPRRAGQCQPGSRRLSRLATTAGPDHDRHRPDPGLGPAAPVARPRILGQRHRRRLWPHDDPGRDGLPVLERAPANGRADAATAAKLNTTGCRPTTTHSGDLWR
ncbi:MAG: hypothetical protein R2715_19440 [Ilumatobacteraceae bacterium]